MHDGARLLRETKRFDRQTLEDRRRIEADRATLALKSRSSCALDRGKRRIEDSPLFGGPSQQRLFADEYGPL